MKLALCKGIILVEEDFPEKIPFPRFWVKRCLSLIFVALTEYLAQMKQNKAYVKQISSNAAKVQLEVKIKQIFSNNSTNIKQH